jgi:hypothetical protein
MYSGSDVTDMDQTRIFYFGVQIPTGNSGKKKKKKKKMKRKILCVEDKGARGSERKGEDQCASEKRRFTEGP